MSILALLPSYVWSFISVLVPFLFVLMVVVFIHEMGHFLVARWCGVRVAAFSIGFGKEITHFVDKHGTRWRLAWIPLGGYVKFADDENGASVPSQEAIEAMSAEERDGAFHAKPLLQRALVVAAGPIANFLLAIVIFAGMFSIVGQITHVARVDIVDPGSPAARAGFQPGDIVREIDGETISGVADLRRIEQFSGGTPLQFIVDRGGVRVALTATPELKDIEVPIGGTTKAGVLGIDTIFLPPLVGAVRAGSAAEAAGLVAGDLILKIDGKPIQRFGDLKKIVEVSAGKRLSVEILRDSVAMTLIVVPQAVEAKTKSGETRLVGRFGIESQRNEADWTYKRHDPLTAVWLGAKETHFVISRTLGYIADVFTAKQSADQLGGPLLIAEVSGQAASRGFLPLLELVAYLSVSIGLINLFPIPLLDGGHLMFYALEAVRGRPLGEKAQEIGFRIGLAVVLALMIFSTWNDIMRKVGQFTGNG